MKRIKKFGWLTLAHCMYLFCVVVALEQLVEAYQSDMYYGFPSGVGLKEWFINDIITNRHEC